MEQEYEVSYDFYKPYCEENEGFKKKMEERKKMLINKYNLKVFDPSEFHVELFSWSVFTKPVLNKLGKWIREYGLLGVIDLSCGNAFHTYLFKEFCGLSCISVDIQSEPSSWSPICETDGRQFIAKWSKNEHKNFALLLSWIDYESLTLDLLNAYEGPMVISVGNYEERSPNYLRVIRDKYVLKERLVLKMPWGLTEGVEVYCLKIMNL